VLTNNFYFNQNISALAERAQLFGLSPAATDIFQLVSWPSKQTNNAMTKKSWEREGEGETGKIKFGGGAHTTMTITSLLFLLITQKICFCNSKRAEREKAGRELSSPIGGDRDRDVPILLAHKRPAPP
jgi:hypothetical protein